MRRLGLLGLAAVTAATVASAPLPAKASPALDPGLKSFTIDCNCSNSGFSGTIGWDFTVSTPVTISYLGVYDENGDGLAVATEVGLWDRDTSTLLASVTVPDGTTGILNGQFRYTSIPSLNLVPGTNYGIGALYVSPGYLQADWYQLITSNNIFADWIVYGTPTEAGGTSLTLPSNVGQSPYGIYGPNLATIAAPATVPGPVPLLGAGVAFSWSRRLRRRVASGKPPLA